eukprot:Sspe_Gene.35721::Locus_17285_Transcript_1_1_Confidence_1.000_Length_853::g.35721::m.35721
MRTGVGLLAVLLVGCAVGEWQQAKTTRYWDCCKPSCAWPSNANKGGTRVTKPVNTCAKDGSVLGDQDANNICAGGGSGAGPAYTCTNQQPWKVSDTVAYGFAAANLECSVCYELDFTSTSLAGRKRMVLQVTNSGSDLGAVHFDIMLPGGGFGIFNGCAGDEAPNGPAQFSEPTGNWGARYGGLSSESQCSGLPKALQAGCHFRFGWFENADNPTAKVRRVRCPDSLVALSGSRRLDDDQYPAPPGDSSIPAPPPVPTPPPAPAPVTPPP